MLTALVTALAFGTSPLPCSVRELHRSPGYMWSVERIQQIVDTADVIVVAKAVARDSVSLPGSARWYRGVRFEMLQQLRGPVAEPVVLYGSMASGDDYNTLPVPYRLVRSSGQRGDCHASEYRLGAQYLLLLKRGERGLDAQWWPLAPVNEQVRGVDDPWVQWVRQRVARRLADPRPKGPDLGAIDAIMNAQADSGFSGVVLVAQGDSVLLRRAYTPGRSLLRVESAFWIASMTKSFTAAAILKLQEQGRLSLRDSLHRFLPDAPADKRAITVMQLITHTSGLGEYTGGGITDRNAAVRAILARPLAFEPGRGYRYGDDDYELLGAIVEIVSGKAWEDYVTENLARPAGLSSVGFACRSYEGKPRPVVVRPVCDWGHKGANGMSATAEDVFRWTRALHKAGIFDKPLVFVRREEPFDVSYGYGVRVYTRGDTTVEVMHSGSGDDGHTSIARVLRSGVTIVVLSNSGQRNGTTWASWVARQLATRE